MLSDDRLSNESVSSSALHGSVAARLPALSWLESLASFPCSMLCIIVFEPDWLAAGCAALFAPDVVEANASKHKMLIGLVSFSQTFGISIKISWLSCRSLRHSSYKYRGRLRKIAMGKYVFRASAPVLMKVAISQHEHHELLFDAVAILSVVLRARSVGCSA